MPFTKKDINQLVDFAHILKAREKFGVYYQNISIIGLVCFLIMYLNFGNLLIPLKLLVWICSLSSLIITLLFIRFYKKELGLFWSVFHNLTIGLIIVFLFIKSNDLLSFNEIETKEYYIQKLELKYKPAKKNRSTYLLPIITVKINGIDRKLKLSPYYYKDAQNTRYVRISTKEGFWNFPIIKSIELIDYQE